MSSQPFDYYCYLGTELQQAALPREVRMEVSDGEDGEEGSWRDIKAPGNCGQEEPILIIISLDEEPPSEEDFWRFRTQS